MANGFQGPPAVDFYSQLSGLGDTLQANAALRQKQQINAARQAAFSDFSALDPNSPDYGKQALTVAQRLGAAGDQDGALKFLTMAQTNADRLHTYQREAVADKRWAITDARAAAAEKRAAADYENTPDQYAPNPKFGQPGEPQYIDQYAAAKAAAETAANGGNPEVGLTPAYGVGKDGKVAAVQFSKTGKAVQTQLPEGFTLSKEPIRVDAGTHINLIDPITRAVVGTLPKNVAEVERQKVAGDAQGQAEVALPQVMATSQQILKTINDVKNHPGKDWSLGIYSKVPTIPGTEQANFRIALGQLQGQTFLQAYQTLRGGGAITDIEGQKGSAALNRMNMAQTKEEFDKAADDFAEVVKGGMLRAAAKARGPAAQSAAPATTGQNVTKSGVPWSIQ